MKNLPKARVMFATATATAVFTSFETISKPVDVNAVSLKKSQAMDEMGLTSNPKPESSSGTETETIEITQAERTDDDPDNSQMV